MKKGTLQIINVVIENLGRIDVVEIWRTEGILINAMKMRYQASKIKTSLYAKFLINTKTLMTKILP